MMILTLIRAFWPYILTGLLAAVPTAYLTHRLDKTSYALLQDSFDKYRSQVEKSQNEARRAYGDALEAELQKTKQTQARNDVIIEGLQNALSTAAASRDEFARELRNYSAASLSGPVPEAPGKPGAAPSGSDPGLGSLTDAIAAVAAEDAANAARCNALIAEIKPQVKE